ncbi:MAG TPA: amidase family protein [Vicinamibacterales bacterium]|nr:amidase family protein [Vicinamibacterales bacterium]
MTLSLRARAFCASAIVAALALRAGAVTRLPSADGQFWDIQDTSPWSQDSGGIATGGRANPFNGFGYLKLRVRAAGAILVPHAYLTGFGLAHDGNERLDSITPVLQGDILVARALFAPKDADYLRYVDSYTNIASTDRVVDVAWGGAAGAFEDGGRVTVATSSNDNRTIDLTDAFVTVMQNAKGAADPMRGPSGHGPSVHVLGSHASGLLTAVGDMYGDPFTSRWPGYDPAHIGYVFTLAVKPGQTLSLMTFVVKGLSEVYDPRGGFPIPLRDALVTPKYSAPYAGPAPRIPEAGSEIARVTAIARRLVASPDVRGLTPLQRAQIVNWRVASGAAATPFSVVEKTVPQIQDALTRGRTTSEDVVREYLARLSMLDRHGPALRSMLALSPSAIADARRLDAERAASGARSPMHGIPVIFKDNIDVLGLPTTGGSRALVDHRPRLDSRVAAGMRRAGAVLLGKANLDEFPFGDFGISTVGGTIGNAFDPTLSTSGSSGGTATAVATSLATLGFGTDTCNSLSNPASFASLATIRTTRGLTSRAGVMPLNTFQDAVGPIAKSIRELALVLDQVTGPDAEDEATADAARHISGSFAAGLDAAALKGARIGVVRQLFVGVTGEREAAATMDTVVKELAAAGATVVDVSIPDLDARYLQARGSAPGSLNAGWTAYLTRGAKEGEPVLTIDGLLSSGKLAPVSARRLRDALQPTPSGDELRAATAKFYATRDEFRALFVGAMDQQRLDALLYPANLARPNTHEGGLERYGEEPGTCQESAMTGLPQVTVPAGFLGGKFPFGVSFLGRLWEDKRLLGLAYAYEQATHHRRPPP